MPVDNNNPNPAMGTIGNPNSTSPNPADQAKADAINGQGNRLPPDLEFLAQSAGEEGTQQIEDILGDADLNKLVEVNGKKIPVHKLIEGFMLQSDYTRKRQVDAKKAEELVKREQQTNNQYGELTTYAQRLAEKEQLLKQWEQELSQGNIPQAIQQGQQEMTYDQWGNPIPKPQPQFNPNNPQIMALQRVINNLQQGVQHEIKSLRTELTEARETQAVTRVEMQLNKEFDAAMARFPELDAEELNSELIVKAQIGQGDQLSIMEVAQTLSAKKKAMIQRIKQQAILEARDAYKNNSQKFKAVAGGGKGFSVQTGGTTKTLGQMTSEEFRELVSQEAASMGME